MKYRHLYTVALALMLAAELAFTFVCKPIKSDATGKYTIFASVYPVYDLCSQLAEGVPGISVYQLMQPTDNSVEYYSLSDRDYALLESCDIAVFAGNGLEAFSSGFSSDTTIIVNATSGLVLKKDADGNANPWIFMSLEGITEFVEAICANLTVADEAYAEKYIDNLERFLEKADGIRSNLPEIHDAGTAAITHKAIEYLCSDFGIDTMLITDCEDLIKAYKESGCAYLLLDTSSYITYKAALKESDISYAVIDTGVCHGDTEGMGKWLDIYSDNVSELKKVTDKI